MSMGLLLVVLFSILPSAPALASSSQPPVDYSFYEFGNSWNNMYTLGCNQVHYDYAVGHNSFVILDFGAIYDNSGDQLNFGNTILTSYRVYQLATAFADGYSQCGPRGAYWLNLAVGTNNSIVLNAAEGSAFATTVKDVSSWANSYAWHVATWGANDIESWNNPSYTYNWYSGYSSQGPPAYIDFGSANGCPTTGYGPACSNGWSQGDYYNLSWNEPLAYSTPEIYYQANASQWAWISAYGAASQPAGGIQPWGPVDQYDLVTSSNTAQQAWNDLCFLFCPNNGNNMNYSFEMHNTN